MLEEGARRVFHGPAQVLAAGNRRTEGRPRPCGVDGTVVHRGVITNIQNGPLPGRISAGARILVSCVALRTALEGPMNRLDDGSPEDGILEDRQFPSQRSAEFAPKGSTEPARSFPPALGQIGRRSFHLSEHLTQ